MTYDTSFLDDLLSPVQHSGTREDLTDHATDWGTEPADGVSPDAVVWPESTEDVVAVLGAANERGVPVTPYAAGTSLEGNPVPSRGGISLDLTRMDRVIARHPDDLLIEVEPGILGKSVDDAVREHGLFFPPLPQSGDISTIGGMIANDASGAKTVHYGEVGDWVRRLEVVLADGTVLVLGSAATKSASGYNLADLIVGSEGTLAVVTAATLELAPIPAQVRGGRAIFDTVDDAATAVAEVVRAGLGAATLELVDALSAEMANAYTGTELPDRPMVFFEFHADHGIETSLEACRVVFERNGSTRFEVADGEELSHLWTARRELAPAVREFRPEMRMLTFGDVTVPISRYPELVKYVHTLADRHDLLVPTFGHAGDGNLHYTALVDPDEPDQVTLAREVMGQIVERAIEMEGTATGEHGVGRGKRGFLEAEHGAAGVALMRRIKRAFDPRDTLNPGKLFPETVDGGRVRLDS